MKLAAPYPTKKSRQELISEYNISFLIGRHKIEDLINWIKKIDLKEKRVNLKVIKGAQGLFLSSDDLKTIKEACPNLYLRVSLDQGEWIPKLRALGLKYFLDYDFNINSFCRLQDAIDQGVTDVYIMEDLCYRLPQVRKICSQHHVRIRLIANTISSFTLGRGTDVTSPFYVPENLPILSRYYDVIEFELFDSWNRFDTLYKIWFIDGQWEEDLKFINFELDMHIMGTGFLEELCEYKMKCGHRCLEQQGSCRKCQQYIEFAQKVNEKEKVFNEETWVENNNDESIKDIF